MRLGARTLWPYLLLLSSARQQVAQHVAVHLALLANLRLVVVHFHEHSVGHVRPLDATRVTCFNSGGAAQTLPTGAWLRDSWAEQYRGVDTDAYVLAIEGQC